MKRGKKGQIDFCNLLVFLSHLRSFYLFVAKQQTLRNSFLRGEPYFFKNK